MNCSVKFLVPIVIVGASPGAPPPFEPPPEPPPQPASATMRAAVAAVSSRDRISGYGSFVARSGARAALERRGDLEAEGAAAPRLALGPDAPAVVLDDALAHRQPDAGAGIVAPAVEAVEGL